MYDTLLYKSISIFIFVGFIILMLVVDFLDMDVYMLDTQLYTLRFYAKELVFLSLLPLLNGVLSVMGVFVFLE